MNNFSKSWIIFFSLIITMGFYTHIHSVNDAPDRALVEYEGAPNRTCIGSFKRCLSCIGQSMRNAFARCVRSKPTVKIASKVAGLGTMVITGKAAYDLVMYLGLSADPFSVMAIIYIAELGTLAVFMKTDGAPVLHISSELKALSFAPITLMPCCELYLKYKFVSMNQKCEDIFTDYLNKCLSDDVSMKDHSDENTFMGMNLHCESEVRKNLNFVSCDRDKNYYEGPARIFYTGCTYFVCSVKIASRYSDIIERWIQARIDA